MRLMSNVGGPGSVESVMLCAVDRYVRSPSVERKP